MKTIYTYLILIGLSTIGVSCKKEKIEEPLPEQQAVFMSQGTIGAEFFSIKAGENNFYMHTFTEQVNGVSLFSGKLSDGDFELQMSIYDGFIDLPSANNQDLPENIQFAMTSLEPLAVLSKDLLPNAAFIQQIKWFVNGTYAGLNNVEIIEPGVYNVCAEVTFNDSSISNLCNEMILGYIKHATCKVRHLLSQNGSLQTWIEEDLVPISSIKWFVDGEFVSDDLKLMTTIDSLNHKVLAEVTFTNGVKRTKAILIDGSLSGKFIDDFSTFEVNSNPSNWDFKVVISLKKDGKVYVSNLAPNQSSTLHITNITYFGQNSAGKMVFKIQAEVSCSLKEVGTGEVLPFNCATVFGLEIN